MRAVLQPMGGLIVIAAGVVGCSFFAAGDYAKKSDLDALNTRLSALQKELADLKGASVGKDDVAALIGRGLKRSAAQYHPVDIDLGTLPVGRTENLTRRIPAAVPDSAREVLVYVYVATRYVSGGPRQFKVSVRLDESTKAAFQMYATAHQQQAWSYNSDNVWLPMPADRELHLSSDGDPLFGDWSSDVRIIAYR